MASEVDPANIQGSIWSVYHICPCVIPYMCITYLPVIYRPRLPRYYESFLFFKLKDIEEDSSYESFKADLRELVKSGKVTTGSDCKKFFDQHDGVNEARERVDTRPEDRDTFNAINVTFSGKGVTKLAAWRAPLKLRDLLHERGMWKDMVYEGPDETLAPEYCPPPKWPKDNDDWRCDGMFIVGAQREDELKATIKDLKSYFRIADDDTVDNENASAKITLVKNGHVRNADGKAHRREIPDEKDPSKKRLENLRGKEQ